MTTQAFPDNSTIVEKIDIIIDQTPITLPKNFQQRINALQKSLKNTKESTLHLEKAQEITSKTFDFKYSTMEVYELLLTHKWTLEEELLYKQNRRAQIIAKQVERTSRLTFETAFYLIRDGYSLTPYI